MTGTIVTGATTPAPRSASREIVHAGSQTTAFHTPEWIEACCHVGGYRDAGRMFGGLTHERPITPVDVGAVVVPHWPPKQPQSAEPVTATKRRASLPRNPGVTDVLGNSHCEAVQTAHAGCGSSHGLPARQNRVS